MDQLKSVTDVTVIKDVLLDFHRININRMNNIEVLQFSLFRTLSLSQAESILEHYSLKESSFKKGAILARQDEVCNRLIFILKGSVKGEMIDPSGKLVKVEDIAAPSPLAILFLFGTSNRFPVQITAKEEVEALIIPKQIILKLLQSNEVVLKNYLDISADFATRLSQKLHFMSFRTIRQKLSIYFLRLAKQRESDTIVLDKSKTALAEYFGVSRPALEREITNMQSDGLIAADKKTITLLDKAKLHSLISF